MDYLEHAKPTFLNRLNLIRWEAAQWIQYVGFEYDKKHDRVFLEFKSSNYGIGFKVEVRTFSIDDEEPYIEYDEAYQFFRNIKYTEYCKD
jgi:hypothetical protein